MTDIGPRERTEDKLFRSKCFDRFDFTGKTVLDIGGCEGAAAASALARGASRAIVLDNESWRVYGPAWSMAGYPYPGVEYVKGDWHDWTEKVDIVIAGNIFYHVRVPWDFLNKIKDLAREGVILWTRVLIIDEEAIWKIDEDSTEADELHVAVWDCSENGLFSMLKACNWRNVEKVGRFEHTIHIVSKV